MRILTYPAVILSKVAEDPTIEFNTVEIITFIDEMCKTMRDANGIGLAAPQVGVSKRIIVFDSMQLGVNTAMINPKITLQGGEVVGEEACLSVPWYSAKIKRSKAVHVDYYDIFKKCTCGQVFKDRDAIVIQHEVDHLNGKLFIDHLSQLKRNMFERKYKKIMKVRCTKTY